MITLDGASGCLVGDWCILGELLLIWQSVGCVGLRVLALVWRQKSKEKAAEIDAKGCCPYHWLCCGDERIDLQPKHAAMLEVALLHHLHHHLEGCCNCHCNCHRNCRSHWEHHCQICDRVYCLPCVSSCFVLLCQRKKPQVGNQTVHCVIPREYPWASKRCGFDR